MARITNSNITQVSSFYQSPIHIHKEFEIDLNNIEDGDTLVFIGGKFIPQKPDLSNNDKVAVSPTDKKPDYLYKKLSDEHFVLDKSNNVIKLKKHIHSWEELDKTNSELNDIEDVDIDKNKENSFLKIENGKIVNDYIEVKESNKIKLNQNDLPDYLPNKLDKNQFETFNGKVRIKDIYLKKDLSNFNFFEINKNIEEASFENIELNAFFLNGKRWDYYLQSSNIVFEESNVENELINLNTKIENKIYYVEKILPIEMYEIDNKFEGYSFIQKNNKTILKGRSGFRFSLYLSKFDEIKIIPIFKEYKKLFNFNDNKEIKMSCHIFGENYVFKEFYKEISFTHSEIGDKDIFDIYILKEREYKNIEIEKIYIEITRF